MKWKTEWMLWWFSRESIVYFTNGKFCIVKCPFGERNGEVYCVCKGDKPIDSENTNFPSPKNLLHDEKFKTLKKAKERADKLASV